MKISQTPLIPGQEFAYSDPMPQKKDTFQLEEIDWNNPLETYTTPLKRTDLISWKAFPKKTFLKHYELELIHEKEKVEQIETAQTYIQLDQFSRL